MIRKLQWFPCIARPWPSWPRPSAQSCWRVRWPQPLVGHRNIGLVDDFNAIVWFGSLYVPGMNRRSDVRIILALAVTALAMATGPARSRTDLTAYADAERYIDVQAPACAALAGTCREMPIGLPLGTVAGTMASRAHQPPNDRSLATRSFQIADCTLQCLSCGGGASAHWLELAMFRNWICMDVVHAIGSACRRIRNSHHSATLPLPQTYNAKLAADLNKDIRLQCSGFFTQCDVFVQGNRTGSQLVISR